MDSNNFFYMVMEAEGDEAVPADDAPPAMDSAPADDGGTDDFEAPPEMPSSAEDTGDPNLDIGGGTDLGSDDMSGGSDEGSSEEGDSEDKKKGQLADKTNNILNERLYDQMITRNKEVEDVIDNLQKIAPILPSDVVYENDKSINQLRQALTKGKGYVIDKFINAEYGENLMFFTKLDSLYTLLMDNINSNLKKIDHSSSQDLKNN